MKNDKDKKDIIPYIIIGVTIIIIIAIISIGLFTT